ncbi:MAG TPA: rhodanese-like domain-containing protein [Candidatus Obscuribacterales bacterium]
MRATLLLASFATALTLCSAPLAAVFANPGIAQDKVAKHGAKLPKITTADLKAKLDKHEPLTLVEALDADYYNNWHLPGAVRMTDPDKNAAKLLPDKNAEIIVYCMNVF